ncbi:vacuolar cation/proton exchanger 1a isoform X2 [Nymphaea colorata]|uniref:vacuolar cation/proton exchanger 1a isoform X2 n=1 Tax=Nymphaea colorata TaxID=210225 RepID=UPI00129E7772|nr:vacuolar cation/proton exchanger 1a isoform X2 [Nymphaea colorata]
MDCKRINGGEDGGALLPDERRLERGLGSAKGSWRVPKTKHGGRTAHNMSSSSLRKKSDLTLLSKVRLGLVSAVLANLQEVILGTKLSVLFPAIPVAFIAYFYHFGNVWIFALSLLGLTQLAERVSFLTEQIALYTGPTVGGLLNATCGNATELIIAILALAKGKMEVVKCSLLGSVLSNMLLVLGTSLFLGGLKNMGKEQKFDQTQSGATCSLLLMSSLCQLLPLIFSYFESTGSVPQGSPLHLSRAGSILMLIAYAAYLFFQLRTHRQLFEATEMTTFEDEDGEVNEEEVVIGLWSAVCWLLGMTAIISILSELVVGTIEDASETWGLSVSFVSVILLPIVGNAAEHAGSIIFAMKNKLDISLGVAMGSAAQISLFVVPLIVIVGWIMGIDMDLDYKLLETASFIMSVIVTMHILQDGVSHYMKGLVLLLCYLMIGATFLLLQTPSCEHNKRIPVVGGKQSLRRDILV